MPIWSVDYRTTPMKSTLHLHVTQSGRYVKAQSKDQFGNSIDWVDLAPGLEDQFGNPMTWVNLAPGVVVLYQGESYIIAAALPAS